MVRFDGVLLQTLPYCTCVCDAVLSQTPSDSAGPQHTDVHAHQLALPIWSDPPCQQQVVVPPLLALICHVSTPKVSLRPLSNALRTFTLMMPRHCSANSMTIRLTFLRPPSQALGMYFIVESPWPSTVRGGKWLQILQNVSMYPIPGDTLVTRLITNAFLTRRLPNRTHAF